MSTLTFLLLYILPLVSHALVGPAGRNNLRISEAKRIARTACGTRRLPWTYEALGQQPQHKLLVPKDTFLSTEVSSKAGSGERSFFLLSSHGDYSIPAPVAEGSTFGDKEASRLKIRDLVPSLLIFAIGVVFRILLKVLNKLKCFNQEALIRAIFKRGDVGLLTVSNHASVCDDPGLIAAITPFWRMSYDQVRWSMCTDDVYNADPRLRSVLKLGRGIPIDRKKGMEQPSFKTFFDKLEQGQWGHIFPEGAVRQPWRFEDGEPILGDFKVGIGRLLLRSKKLPMVLPIYHIGMHQVAPELPVRKRTRGKLVKLLPNFGRKILVYVGEPIDVKSIVEECRAEIGDVGNLPWSLPSTSEEIECHKKIATYVRDHVLKLEARARQDYYGVDPSSPYSTVGSEAPPASA